MRLSLADLKGANAQSFMDHFNAALRERKASNSGSASSRPDGIYEVTLNGKFPLPSGLAQLSWRIVRSANGDARSLEVTNQSEPPDPRWETEVREFISDLLLSVLGNRTSTYLRRSVLTYFGPNFSGEYWLNGTRIGPALPNDEGADVINWERALYVDQKVEAVDALTATNIAVERTKMWGAYLSLLLNTGVAIPKWESRWCLDPADINRPLRQTTGFPAKPLEGARLPRKGQLCPLAIFAGSLAKPEWPSTAAVTLPVETRQVVAALRTLAPRDKDTLDRCARLYQTALLAFRMTPTAGLAYLVACVEAIAYIKRRKVSFTDFMLHTVGEANVDRPSLNLLYQDVRSAHFHSGAFPLGDFSHDWHDITDPASSKRASLRFHAPHILIKAIRKWLLKHTASSRRPSGRGA